MNDERIDRAFDTMIGVFLLGFGFFFCEAIRHIAILGDYFHISLSLVTSFVLLATCFIVSDLKDGESS